MSVVVVTDKDFEEKVLKSSLPVVVDFFAEWCGPCKMAEPVLDEMSEEYKDKIVFVKMNVDENPEYPGKYGIMSIPTTVLVKNGEEVGRQIGFAGKAGFVELVNKA